MYVYVCECLCVCCAQLCERAEDLARLTLPGGRSYLLTVKIPKTPTVSGAGIDSVTNTEPRFFFFKLMYILHPTLCNHPVSSASLTASFRTPVSFDMAITFRALFTRGGVVVTDSFFSPNLLRMIPYTLSRIFLDDDDTGPRGSVGRSQV